MWYRHGVYQMELEKVIMEIVSVAIGSGFMMKMQKHIKEKFCLTVLPMKVCVAITLNNFLIIAKLKTRLT